MTASRLLPLLLLLTACATSTPAPAPDFLARTEPKARILLLGTFHFADQGLDAYKPQHRLDVLSAERQREIAAIVEALARFRPTKIAVETKTNRQAQLDETYRAYLAGTRPLTPDETQQLGFRLGKQLGHQRLHAIDVNGRTYTPAIDLKGRVPENPWDARFMKLYAHDDELKTRRPLRDTFLYINSRERVRLGHGHYLTGAFHVGEGDDYSGVDDVVGWWYSRNLRIFENVHRLIESPQERIVVIIGAGHLPILRHAFESAPDIELVDVADVL